MLDIGEIGWRKLGALLFYALTLWEVGSGASGNEAFFALGGTIVSFIWSAFLIPGCLLYVASMLALMFLPIENSDAWSFLYSIIGTAFLPLMKAGDLGRGERL